MIESLASAACWTRRAWLARNVVAAATTIPVSRLLWHSTMDTRAAGSNTGSGVSGRRHGRRVPDDQATLVQHAVDAAMHAGATYADARFTYTRQHLYHFDHDNTLEDLERVGIGVRALVQGAWGFASCPSGSVGDVEQLARDAVAQAVVNARGAVVEQVELGHVPIAVGHWETPVELDPFTIPIEEKRAFMCYWMECAKAVGLAIDPMSSKLHFAMQDRAVATSDGSRFTQTVYESGGIIKVISPDAGSGLSVTVRGIDTAGRGWELFLDAEIPQQIQKMPQQFPVLLALQRSTRPAAIGRYTLVCDGATMAALVEATLGIATQLDRALGYEANAGGTSFLNDPLRMVGSFPIASPLVTITANRSAPAQLATVKWDTEGVTPSETVLIKEGVLSDFQTTREQAAWLAPYYRKIGRSTRSNGCAAAESALYVPLQHTPNLTLVPGSSAVDIDDLVANVKDGILIEQGDILQVDSQARNGVLISTMMREIRNGHLGAMLSAGAIQFHTLDLWKQIVAIGGTPTQMVRPFSQYQPYGGEYAALVGLPVKGEPPQLASHSVQAVAATITSQSLINPARKA